MSWSILMTKAAERDMSQLFESDRETIIQAIDKLAQDPSLVDIRKLKGHKNEWRLRVGQWRVRFTFVSRKVKVKSELHGLYFRKD